MAKGCLFGYALKEKSLSRFAGKARYVLKVKSCLRPLRIHYSCTQQMFTATLLGCVNFHLHAVGGGDHRH
jgi:hypothetical protein